MFEPRGNMILVEQIPVETKTESGIITSTIAEEKRQQLGQQVGIVRKLGADAYNSESGFHGTEPYCEIGDVVLFPRYSGTQYQESEVFNRTTVEGEVHWHVMQDTDVMGVMPEEQANQYKQQRGVKE